MTEEEVASKVAEFVLNHSEHIDDDVADFGLLKPMLELLRASLNEH